MINSKTVEGWMNTLTSTALGCAVLILCGFASGCGKGAEGPPVGAVSGQVTFEGKPVATGQVHFANDEKGYMFVANIENGAFRAQSQHGSGLPYGSYKVKITPPPSVGGAAGASPTEVKAPEAADIPAKYRDFGTSGFTAEAKEGAATQLTFDMKK